MEDRVNRMWMQIATATFVHLLSADLALYKAKEIELRYLGEFPIVMRKLARAVRSFYRMPPKLSLWASANLQLCLSMYRLFSNDVEPIQFIADATSEFRRKKKLDKEKKERLTPLLQRMAQEFSNHHQFEKIEKIGDDE